MTAKPAVDEIRLSRVLLLLALSVFINYLDRGNLSIAAPACGTLADGILISRFGWRPVFLLVGLTSLDSHVSAVVNRRKAKFQF